MTPSVFEFGDFKLDGHTFVLSRAGHEVRLERKPLELLFLLVGRPDRLVTRSEIAGHLWGNEVFVDTEHGINTAIRKVRQALREDPEQPQFILTVTGKGYRFIAPVNTLCGVTQPSQYESAIELTPDPTSLAPGNARPFASDADQAPSTPTPSPFPPFNWVRSLVLATFVALALAAAMLALNPASRAWTIRLLHKTRPAEINSLAVLPLDNLSGDPSQDYIAAGVTDELTTMLAKNSTLRIVSRTSMMHYKGTRLRLPEIAQEVGADGLLEGSVTRSGNRAHVTIQLIQAATDKHLWAESYDRDPGDLEMLPREISINIARLLQSSVPQPAPRYVTPAAYDAYQHGRYLFFTDKTPMSGVYFKQAVQLQPDYALGWSGLADYYAAAALIGNAPPLQVKQLAKDAAAEAVSIDPTSSEAHLSLAGVILSFDWDCQRALSEIDKAIQLDPRFGEAWHLRWKILSALNRHQEAIESEKKATELEPFAKPWGMNKALVEARQYDAALREIEQRLEASPQDVTLLNNLAETYQRKGMFQEYAKSCEASLRLQGDNAAADTLHQDFAKGGYLAVVQRQLANLQATASRQYVQPMNLAVLTARLGQREETLSLLEQAYQQRAPRLLWIQVDPAYDFLHADPHYRDLIRRIGIPPAW